MTVDELRKILAPLAGNLQVRVAVSFKHEEEQSAEADVQTAKIESMADEPECPPEGEALILWGDEDESLDAYWARRGIKPPPGYVPVGTP